MNRAPDVDLVLRDYFADDGGAAPDYVLDAVQERIRRQPQRRTWPFQRRTNVTTQIKLIAALAAVLVVAVVGYRLLPGQAGPGGPSIAPTASPQPAASSFASAAGVADLPEGPLSGGRYRFHPLAGSPYFSADADIPAGWIGAPPWAVLGPTTEEPPDGLLMGFLRADGLFSDPCQWDLDGSRDGAQVGDVEIGASVTGLVDALRANTSYTVSAPTPLTIGSYDGQELEIQLPADLELSTCDTDEGGEPRYFVFSGKEAGLYAQGNGTDSDRWRLFIVNVDGALMILAVLYFPGTPAALQEAVRPIVESIEFDTRP